MENKSKRYTLVDIETNEIYETTTSLIHLIAMKKDLYRIDKLNGFYTKGVYRIFQEIN